jgi:hypothetical protein
MDFVEGLPRVNDKSIILTVLDRLSKYTHFIVLDHPYTATSIARAFFDSIIRLHDILGSSVSDHGLMFTSKFWTEFFAPSGVSLNLTSAFHPQADD